MKILVSGSLAYDRIMNFPGYFKDNILPEKIHILNVSFTVSDLRQNFGGTAGNIAYNLALLGGSPVILANAGRDFIEYREWLNKNKVDTSQVKILKNQLTACAHIITDKADNQITGFHGGAMFCPGGKIPPALLKQAELAIVAPGNVQDMVSYSTLYQKSGLAYVFDPGQAIPVFTGGQLRQCIAGSKVFISNDYELSLVLKKTGWSKNQLLQETETAITTLGEKGSLIEFPGKQIKIPIAKPKSVLDPTGAGDAYRAGLIRGLIKNYAWEKIGRLAALVSVYTVETYGTQTHKFNWTSLSERYRQNFKERL